VQGQRKSGGQVGSVNGGHGNLWSQGGDGAPFDPKARDTFTLFCLFCELAAFAPETI